MKWHQKATKFGLYKKWHDYRYAHHVHVAVLVLYVLAILVSSLVPGQNNFALAANGSWSQTSDADFANSTNFFTKNTSNQVELDDSINFYNKFDSATSLTADYAKGTATATPTGAIQPGQTGKLSNAARVESASTNLYLNSSFETDANSDGLADSWIKEGSNVVTTIDSDASVGNKSQKLTTVSVPGDEGIRQTVTTTASTVYSVSLKIKVTLGKAVILVANGSSPWTTYKSYYINAPNNQWETIKLDNFTTDGGSTATMILIRNQASSANNTIYADGAQIEQKAYSTSYIGENKLLTPSFETDGDSNGVGDNFTLSGSGGTYSLDATEKVISSKSQKIVKASASADYIYQGQNPYVISPGESYTYSIWVKGNSISGTENGSDFGIYSIAHRVGGGWEPNAIVAAPVGTFGWTRITVTQSYTNDCDYIVFHPMFRNKTGTAWFDGAKMEPGSSDTGYTEDTNADSKWERPAGTLTYPTASNFNASQGAIEMWVKPSWNGNDGWNHKFIKLYSDANNFLQIYKDDSTSNLSVIFTGGGTSKTVSYQVNATNFAADTWHHLATTWTVGGSLNLYLDGVSVGTPASGVTTMTVPASMYIGSVQDGTLQADSLIDDFRIYNRALSSAETNDIYNSGTGKVATTPKADSGNIVSPSVPTTVAHQGKVYGWTSAVANKTDSLGGGGAANTTLKLQVLDGSSALLPDGVLSAGNGSTSGSNSAGFQSTTGEININLTAVSSSTYPALKLRANLATTNYSNTPVLQDWTVNYSYDITAPAITAFSINAGAQYTTSRDVTLALTATDGESGVYQMRFQNAGEAWSGWEAYNTSKAWTLSAGDGTKSVAVQVKDNVGNTATHTTAPSTSTSPVADWQAMTQGNHYGNFYDNVSGTWATVSRTGTKTIYDPDTKKIYDVPANYLAINPRSDDKGGSEAVIEESRTNTFLRSYILGDTEMAAWTAESGLTAAKGTSPHGLYGSSVGATITADSSNRSFYQQRTLTAASWNISFYARRADGGAVSSADCNVAALAGTGVPTGVASSFTSMGGGWYRVSATVTGTAATWGVGVRMVAGRSLTVDAMQAEAGAFATSYIPTTTATGTRNADLVTVPTTGWNKTAGTFVAVAGPGSGASLATLAYWSTDANNNVALWQTSSNMRMRALLNSVDKSSDKAFTAGQHVFSGTWIEGGNVISYVDAVAGTAGNPVNTWQGTPGATAYIGAAGSRWGGPISRLLTYSVELSGSDITTVTNAIKDGAGSIILDSSAPTISSFSVNSNAQFTTSKDVNLAITADDGSGGGVAEMQFSNNGQLWSAYEPYSTTKAWDLNAVAFGGSAGDGTKSVFVHVKDAIGNVATYTTASSVSPVADWQAMTEGNHYGRFFDNVSGTWATVTRAGAKTIYDPDTGKIYDVPANYLGVNPRSDNKGGSEAVIEESRTNYLLNSYGAQNSSGGWTGGWSEYHNTSGTPTRSIVPGVYGSTAQRTTYTSLNDSNKIVRTLNQRVTGFTEGEVLTLTAWVKSDSSGILPCITIQAYNSGGGYVGSSDTTFSASTPNWTRVTKTYTLPATSTQVDIYVRDSSVGSIDTGDVLDITVDAIQLEKGAFATSYIPTTTATGTRNADVVTVPTTNWSYTNHALFVVGSVVGSGDVLGLPGTSGNVNMLYADANAGGALWPNYYGADGVGQSTSAGSLVSGQIATMVSRLTGSTTFCGFVNGTKGSDQATDASNGIAGSAYIGGRANQSKMANSGVQRLLAYSSALSDSDITTVYNAVKDGAGDIILDATAPTVSASTITSPNGSEKWQGGSSQTITWNPALITDDGSGFSATPIKLEYTTNDADYTQIATGEANDGSYTWNPLPSISSTTVKVRITATDQAGNSGTDSSDANFTIDSATPTVPTALTFGSATSSTIPLSWTASTDADSGVAGYEVQRAPDSAGNPGTWANVATGPCSGVVAGVSCTDNSSLSANTKYWYRVRAKDNVGLYSGYSGEMNVDSNVKGLWHLNGARSGSISNGTTAGFEDASGNGNNGTASNANGTGMAWTDGKLMGGGVSFDGTDDYAIYGDNGTLDITGSLTVEAWINATTFASDQRTIAAKWNGSGNQRAYMLNTETDGRARFYVCADGACASGGGRKTNTVLSTGTWYHIAAVYNSTTQSVDMYLNGNLDNGSALGTIPSSINGSSTAPFSMGQMGGGAGAAFFQGKIDEVRVSSTNRSGTDIQNYYNEANPNPKYAITPSVTTPTGLTFGTVTSNEIPLSWGAVSDTDLDGYKIERATDSGGYPTGWTQIKDITDNATSWTDNAANNPGSPPQPNTKYYYRLRAYNTNGNNSAYSGEMNSDGSSVKGLWHLNEGSGGTTADSSGNGGTGTFAGTSYWTSGNGGKFGEGLNGSGDDYIAIPDSDNIDFGASQNFTIEAWIKTSTSTNDLTIIEKFSGSGYPYAIRTTSSGTRAMFLRYDGTNNPSAYSPASVALNNGNWHYIAVVKNGSSLTFYADGVAGTAGTDTTTGTTTNSSALTIGSRGASQYFIGQIDELRFSNTNRSGTDIQNYYNEANSQPKYTTTLTNTPTLNAPTTPTNDARPQVTGNVSGAGSGVTVNLYDGATPVAKTRTDGSSNFSFGDNKLSNPSFETDTTPADGLADGWSVSGNVTGTSAKTLVSPGVNSAYAQRLQYTGVATDTSKLIILTQSTANGTFVAGDTATASIYVKGSNNGCSMNMYVRALDSGDANLGNAGQAITLTGNFTKISKTYTNLPANTSKVAIIIEAYPVDNGDTIDLYADNAKVDNYNQNLTDGNHTNLTAKAVNGGGVESPASNAVTAFIDTQNPTTPVSSSAWTDSGKTSQITDNAWSQNNYVTSAYFEWAAGTDPDPASNVKRYHVYFGSNSSAIPAIDGTPTTAAETNATRALSNPTSGTDYYMRIQTEDNAGNLSTPETRFTYKFDNTNPDQVAYVIPNPPGWAEADPYSFSWPAATDGHSGVNGYEYKRGNGEGWTYTNGLSVNNINHYQTGVNVFYLRTKDNAGNFSSAVYTNYYYSGTVGAPQNLVADLSQSQGQTVNSYKFTWDAPLGVTAQGYYYSVNATPTPSNSTYTTNDFTDFYAAATQQGLNTFYVVCKDEFDNIGWNQPASAAFSINTVAPGVPQNITITDASNRNTSNWALTVGWTALTGQPPDFNGYEVWRCTANCDNEANFNDKRATVSTNIFSEAGLANTTDYYYKVKSKDNVGNTSAFSSSVHKIPTGKYTTPPTYTSNPTADAKALSVTIHWTTNRASNTVVQYGTTTGYGQEASKSTEAVTDHTIEILGLNPGTTYHFRVQSLDADRDYDPATAFSSDYTFATLAAPGISEVQISEIRLTTAIITWKTTSSATSTILYGTTSAYGATYTDQSASQTTTHTVKLTELSDSTTYNFKIQGTDVDGNTLSSDNYVFSTLTFPKLTGLKVEQVPNTPTSTIKVSFDSNVPTSTLVTAVGKNTKDTAKYDLERSHEIKITGLLDDSTYTVTVRGRDQYGNEAVPLFATYKTDFDTRPPLITEITTETSITGFGVDAKGQIVVSWTTDEPATSQIEYGPGVTGTDYTGKTQEDTSLTENHVVIISDLKPSAPYHFRIISKDKSQNTGISADNSVLTQQANESILDLIIKSLQSTIGWIFNIFRK